MIERTQMNDELARKLKITGNGRVMADKLIAKASELGVEPLGLWADDRSEEFLRVARDLAHGEGRLFNADDKVAIDGMRLIYFVREKEIQ